MSITPEPVVEFNRQLMAEDAAVKGFSKSGWAAKAKVSDMTVIRFLRGDKVTPAMVAKLAKSLGYTAERYIIRKSKEALLPSRGAGVDEQISLPDFSFHKPERRTRERRKAVA